MGVEFEHKVEVSEGGSAKTVVEIGIGNVVGGMSSG